MTHAYPHQANEPDIDRAAEGLSRPAPAPIAGAADAGVRARHRARRGHGRRQFRARATSQGRARNRGRRRGAAADRRSGAPVVWSARAVSRREQFSRQGRADPACIAAADLAMAGPRRRARGRARIRNRARRDQAERQRPPASKARPASSSSPQPTRSSISPHRSRATTGSGRWPVSARPMSSRTCCRSAACCGRARRWIRSAAGCRARCGCFRKSQIASVSSALNVPSLQTPQLLPFALSLIMQRLAQPWQIIRLAIKMAASDDEIRVAATPYGIAVTIALHDLSFLTACLRTDIRRGHFDNVGEPAEDPARWRARAAHRARPAQRFRMGPPAHVDPRRNFQFAAVGDRERAGPGPPHPAPARRQGYRCRAEDRRRPKSKRPPP